MITSYLSKINNNKILVINWVRGNTIKTPQLSLTVDQKIAPSAFYKGHFKELLVIYDYF